MIKRIFKSRRSWVLASVMIAPFAIALAISLACDSGVGSVEIASPAETTSVEEPIWSPCEGLDADCTPRDVTAIDLFTPPAAQGAAFEPQPAATVEDVLESGLVLAGASPAHLVVRGTSDSDSVRCQWRGIARSLAQREEAIRFWLEIEEPTPLPSPTVIAGRFDAELERINSIYPETVKANFRSLAMGGLTEDYMFLGCYVDYTVSEYLLGPTITNTESLTVAYDRRGEARSYDLYKLAHEQGEFGEEVLFSEEEYGAYLEEIATTVEMVLDTIFESRESVLFLAPMGAHNTIAIEAWQVIEQWDLQLDDQGVVQAVRYGVAEGDPEHTQTLANLRSRITTAAASDAYADDRIGNVSGLNQYYRDIGAYDDITPDDGSTDTFTPSQPPAVYAPAPAGLTATLSGNTGAELSWDAVTDATGYHVQNRISVNTNWTTLDDSATGTTYSAADLLCESGHEFRIGAYGDGSTYNERAGLWSEVVMLTTGTCNLPPAFVSSSYAFSVEEDEDTGEVVGTVSATDPDAGDTLAYSITAGNESGGFSVGSSTGQITVAGELSYASTPAHTLTVEVRDSSGATAEATVTITVTSICRNGVVVPSPADNPGLVEDCLNLYGSRGTLSGSGSIDWDGETAISSWEGIRVYGTPSRVRMLRLTDVGLNGSIPTELGELSGLSRIDLDENDLTGGIPAELGRLSQLTHLYLFGNQLSGGIPEELGNLSRLQVLYLEDNRMSGEIPEELGNLNALRVLALNDNDLSGSIPSELGNMGSLEQLLLRDNRLTGSMPRSLSRLNLTHVALSGNSFGGCIPVGLLGTPNNDFHTAEFQDMVSCAPTFYVNSYTFRVAEDASVGDVVGTIYAEAIDLSALTYSITAGNEGGKFQMNSVSGELSVAGVLDFETTTIYTLTAAATDSHGAASTIRVTVRVTDVVESP